MAVVLLHQLRCLGVVDVAGDAAILDACDGLIDDEQRHEKPLLRLHRMTEAVSDGDVGNRGQSTVSLGRRDRNGGQSTVSPNRRGWRGSIPEAVLAKPYSEPDFKSEYSFGEVIHWKLYSDPGYE